MGATEHEAVALDAATELEGDRRHLLARAQRRLGDLGPERRLPRGADAAGGGTGRPRSRARSATTATSSARPMFDRVELTVESVKQGRRSESLAVRMTQDGREVMVALVRTAAEGPGYRHQEVDAPAVTGPETSQPVERLATDGSPALRVLEQRQLPPPADRPDGGRFAASDPGVGSVRAGGPLRGPVRRRCPAADPARHLRLAGRLDEASREPTSSPRISTPPSGFTVRAQRASGCSSITSRRSRATA